MTGATAVKFGSSAAASVKDEGPTKIIATSPVGSGTVQLTVTTAGGTSVTGPADVYDFMAGGGA